jgi:hypothetical protein
MRKALIAILMSATVATPLAAAPGEGGNRRQMESGGNEDLAAVRAERQAQRAQRQAQRAQRAQEAPQARQAQADRGPRAERRADRVENRAERRADRVEERSERRADRIEQRGDLFGGRIEQRLDRRAERIEDRGERRADRIEDRGERRADRIRDGRDVYRGGWNEDIREVRREVRQERREDRREYRQDRRDYRQDRRAERRWDRSWRNDRRYDWQRYRYTNRNLYRPGRYYAPYRNHSYSRFSIGLVLGSAFLGDRYWINDPWQYRLPHAYPGTRWVRYYDDVLLVDTYTGEVIDVIHDFFW